MMMIEMKRKEMDNKKRKAIIKTVFSFQNKTEKIKISYLMETSSFSYFLFWKIISLAEFYFTIKCVVSFACFFFFLQNITIHWKVNKFIPQK